MNCAPSNTPNTVIAASPPRTATALAESDQIENSFIRSFLSWKNKLIPPRSPPGSVPQASQQHGHHQVPIRLPTPMTVPSHRNIEVIPQPGRKADMPMPP